MNLSRKRRKLNTVASEWRRSYLAEIHRCDWCGCRVLERLSLHEITQGAGRKASLTEPAALLVLCDGFANNCHYRIHQLGKRGKVFALALLYVNRPSAFDLEKVHRLRGDNWPGLDEVMIEVRKLSMGGE